VVLNFRTLEDFAPLGLGTDVLETLADLVDDDCTEEQVVAALRLAHSGKTCPGTLVGSYGELNELGRRRDPSSTLFPSAF
jgi:hypothetical protein